MDTHTELSESIIYTDGTITNPETPIQTNEMKQDSNLKLADFSKLSMLNIKAFSKELDREPKRFYCEDCKRDVLSQVSYGSGPGSLISSCFITMLGFWCGCCLLPFCLKDCQDVSHLCTSCGKELEKVKFLLN